ncbi:MAG: hypothetical protein M3O41_16530 [Pseudomonadota bacterium]|nr:hypothetical protein [Pseudomonadota bacterium]
MPKSRTAGAPTHRKIFGPGRSRLRQAQGERRHALFNLWYHYSPRLQRDVILKSDIEFAHFCWLEGDPSVVRYELEPDPIIVSTGTKSRQAHFDVLVEFRANKPQLREIKSDETDLLPSEIARREEQTVAATTAGFDYGMITHATIAEHRQLIANWRCALAYQAACRELVLEPQRAELAEIFRLQRHCTVDVALRETDPAMRSVYLAALFKCLQDGKLASDLELKPLCAYSQVWVTGSQDG